MITSFTSQVVAELAPHVPPLACCRAALLEGMQLTAAPDENDAGSELSTTRAVTARAALQTLHADHRPAHVERLRAPRRSRYRVVAGGKPVAAAGDGSCCARSRLRGAFLAGGAVSRPDAAPQLEILCASSAGADWLCRDALGLGVSAVALTRRGRPLLAVRSAEGVAALLSSIGAQTGRLRFEEGRVVRDLRSQVNRSLNSETANLRRTVAAAVLQARAIRRLSDDRERWQALPPALREAAVLRQRHPRDSLDRLAGRAGCSRSAMADRLRRLLVTADLDGGRGRR